MGEKHEQYFPVIVIGGGISGIGIFRDLCLHGIDTLLVDRGRFMSQTSSRSSKLLHGGIRYLETGDFPLIKSALEEKNLWAQLCPDICKEEPFHFLCYKESKYPRWALKLGLEFYDFLSSYTNSANYLLSAKETQDLFPGIKTQNLRGCGVYFDVVMDDTLLGLRCLDDALLTNPRSKAREFFPISKVSRLETSGPWQVFGEDLIKKTQTTYITDHIILCAGPFTDQVLKGWNIDPNIPWKSVMRPSRGAHLWLDDSLLPIPHPLVLNTTDNRIFFMVPHNFLDGGKRKILVGTTELGGEDMTSSKDYFNPCILPEETQYIKEQVEYFFPNLRLQMNHIKDSFVGFRPLVASQDTAGNISSSRLSRDHEIFQPYNNFDVLTGGKYTTFRIMGQEITRRIVEKKGKQYNPNLTKNRPRLG